MPSIAGHMVIAKLVSSKLGIESSEFIKGNLLPDIINMRDSHHKIKGKHFYIPDIDYFKRNLDLEDPLYLGYYTHLLLDKYFLEDFFSQNIKNLEVFSNGIVYNEYSLLNYQLVRKFGLDVDYLTWILSSYEVDIDRNGLKKNLKCLSNTEIGETVYLKFVDFAKFLEDISLTIGEEIEDYASKSNMLLIRSRK